MMREIIYDYDYMDMDLGFAFRFLNKSNILTTAHMHNYFEYFLITNGSITHTANGTRKTLKVGDLVLIRPDDYHSYDLIETAECNLINVSFSSHHFFAACQYIGNNAQQQFLSPMNPPKINIATFPDCTLVEDHDFLNFYVRGNTELYMRLRLLLIDMLVTFIRYTKIKNGSHYDEWLHRALAEMTYQKNLEEGVPALIRITGFSHGHLCRIMKQQVGMSPNQYITKLRMVYASNLLRNSDDDILTISYKAGYPTLSHFITVFKKHYGLPPLKFRQQQSMLGEWK